MTSTIIFIFCLFNSYSQINELMPFVKKLIKNDYENTHIEYIKKKLNINKNVKDFTDLELKSKSNNIIQSKGFCSDIDESKIQVDTLKTILNNYIVFKCFFNFESKPDSTNRTTIVVVKTKYIIAFNLKTLQFYYLSGFKNSSIKDFFKSEFKEITSEEEAQNIALTYIEIINGFNKDKAHISINSVIHTDDSYIVSANAEYDKYKIDYAFTINKNVDFECQSQKTDK